MSPRNSMSIETDLVFARVVDIDFTSVSGTRLSWFKVSDGNRFVSCLGVEKDLVLASTSK